MAASAGNGGNAVDTKILGKPGKFDDSEEKFAEWSFVTREYVALWQPSLHEMMLKAEKLGEKPIALTDFSLEEHGMTDLMYGLLSQILTGKAMKRHTAVSDRNGLESW